MDYTRIDPDALKMVAAARRLVRANGLSLRDAAAVLGVTFSRVQQPT